VAAQAPEPLPAQANQLTPQELEELLNIHDKRVPGGTEQPFLTTLPGVALLTLLGLFIVAGVLVGLLVLAWRHGMGALAHYQQPYEQLLRLGRWFGSLRGTPSDTPFELAENLARQVPRAGPAIRELTAVYVEATYADRRPEANPWPGWLTARRDVIRGLFRRRLRRWFGDDGSPPSAPHSHPELLRQWGASRSSESRQPRSR
jgi:hypothetical protein